MSTNQISKGKVLAGSLAFRNDGTASVHGIYHATATVDVASMLTDAEADVAITITGVAVGDLVLIEPVDLAEGVALVSAAARCSADTATVTVLNTSSGTVNPASATWRYTWFDLT